MSEAPLWRVGHRADPLGFVPWELFQASRRFDDPERRFRTVYCAERPATALREVLADFRPNLEEIEAFVEVFGEPAREELVAGRVTSSWRQSHVLAPADVQLDGTVVDLIDPAVRSELEGRHRGLLRDHGLDHLDLHEITTRRRAITQAIVADVYDRLDAAAIRFPSSLDASPCLAVFEGRGQLIAAGDPIALTDPAPDVLATVCEEWNLQLDRGLAPG